MSTQVKVVGMLAGYVKPNSMPQSNELAGLTVEAVIERIGIPRDLVAFVMVNGSKRDKKYVLQVDDEAKLIPFVGGG